MELGCIRPIRVTVMLLTFLMTEIAQLSLCGNSDTCSMSDPRGVGAVVGLGGLQA